LEAYRLAAIVTASDWLNLLPMIIVDWLAMMAMMSDWLAMVAKMSDWPATPAMALSHWLCLWTTTTADRVEAMASSDWSHWAHAQFVPEQLTRLLMTGIIKSCKEA
jgi:hypothetical protein